MLILDQQRRTVADLGTYSSPLVPVAIQLERQRFVPEQDRRMLIGHGGYGIQFTGASGSGEPLPNGYYRAQLVLEDGTKLEAAFYLEHAAWEGGQVAVILPPRATEAWIAWNYPETVEIRFDLYNLAGELIWMGKASAQMGKIRWAMSSTSGQPVSGGVYLLRVRARSQDGSLEDEQVKKLAVVR